MTTNTNKSKLTAGLGLSLAGVCVAGTLSGMALAPQSAYAGSGIQPSAVSSPSSISSVRIYAKDGSYQDVPFNAQEVLQKYLQRAQEEDFPLEESHEAAKGKLDAERLERIAAYVNSVKDLAKPWETQLYEWTTGVLTFKLASLNNFDNQRIDIYLKALSSKAVDVMKNDLQEALDKAEAAGVDSSVLDRYRAAIQQLADSTKAENINEKIPQSAQLRHEIEKLTAAATLAKQMEPYQGDHAVNLKPEVASEVDTNAKALVEAIKNVQPNNGMSDLDTKMQTAQSSLDKAKQDESANLAVAKAALKQALDEANTALSEQNIADSTEAKQDLTNAIQTAQTTHDNPEATVPQLKAQEESLKQVIKDARAKAAAEAQAKQEAAAKEQAKQALQDALTSFKSDVAAHNDHQNLTDSDKQTAQAAQAAAEAVLQNPDATTEQLKAAKTELDARRNDVNAAAKRNIEERTTELQQKITEAENYLNNEMKNDPDSTAKQELSETLANAKKLVSSDERNVDILKLAHDTLDQKLQAARAAHEQALIDQAKSELQDTLNAFDSFVNDQNAVKNFEDKDQQAAESAKNAALAVLNNDKATLDQLKSAKQELETQQTNLKNAADAHVSEALASLKSKLELAENFVKNDLADSSDDAAEYKALTTQIEATKALIADPQKQNVDSLNKQTAALDAAYNDARYKFFADKLAKVKADLTDLKTKQADTKDLTDDQVKELDAALSAIEGAPAKTDPEAADKMQKLYEDSLTALNAANKSAKDNRIAAQGQVITAANKLADFKAKHPEVFAGKEAKAQQLLDDARATSEDTSVKTSMNLVEVINALLKDAQALLDASHDSGTTNGDEHPAPAPSDQNNGQTSGQDNVQPHLNEAKKPADKNKLPGTSDASMAVSVSGAFAFAGSVFAGFAASLKKRKARD